ncbi:MFS transporter [Trinickia dinghuensis]|uniref:MFS transporter n=1 Tax=Trinickia dinghuensis TaxID=2291023 RepID=A0A3D8JT39_9BURK|nr:MFS transporter [Trinickia dinghuensis]RDU96237.1 MFS transporter [Trinickia dinghuensis]
MTMSHPELIDFGKPEVAVAAHERYRLWVAILVGIVGPEVFIVQPAVVDGYVKYLGFGLESAGYAASIEVWGIALSTILLPFVSKRIDWRMVVAVSAVMMMLGNAASALVTDRDVFLAARLLVGFGAGGLISISFATVGLTRDPDRNFGYLVMWVMIYGALGLWLVPSVFEFGGLKPMLWFFAAFPLTVLPFVGLLPRGGDSVEAEQSNGYELPPRMKACALAATLMYFVALGGIWTYLFLVGTANGFSEQRVADGLTLSQLAGVLGAWLVGLFGGRVGRRFTLTVSILGGALCSLLLIGHAAYVPFVVAVCGYNFFWNVAQPALLSSMAAFDRRGQMVLAATAMQMVGLALGPALAAYIVTNGDYTRVIGIGVALFVVSWWAIHLAVRKHAALLHSDAGRV